MSRTSPNGGAEVLLAKATHISIACRRLPSTQSAPAASTGGRSAITDRPAPTPTTRRRHARSSPTTRPAVAPNGVSGTMKARSRFAISHCHRPGRRPIRRHRRRWRSMASSQAPMQRPLQRNQAVRIPIAKSAAAPSLPAIGSAHRPAAKIRNQGQDLSYSRRGCSMPVQTMRSQTWTGNEGRVSAAIEAAALPAPTTIVCPFGGSGTCRGTPLAGRAASMAVWNRPVNGGRGWNSSLCPSQIGYGQWRAAENEVSGLLGDHDRWRVGVG